jgi:hypothetical protein
MELKYKLLIAGIVLFVIAGMAISWLFAFAGPPQG